MRNQRTLLFAVSVAAALQAVVTGCGDNFKDVQCGDGTTLSNGTCIAATNCGAGTIEMNGQCVPDGSMICEQGTVYDATAGGCVIDPSACAPGTVLFEGQCQPEGTINADHKEAAEPNESPNTPAGMFAAPAVGQSTTLSGCVRPTDGNGDGALDIDNDTWLVTASGPTALEITADGVRGLSAGYVVRAVDPNLLPALNNYIRFGVNLTGDTAKRQLYLPAAGVYALTVTDGRSLFFGTAAGDPTGNTSCYYATVSTIPVPTATAVTLPSTAGQNSGNLRVLTHTANGAGDIFDSTLNSDSETGSPAFIVLRNGTFAASAAPVPGFFGNQPPTTTNGGLNPGDTITLVVDWEYNYGLDALPYSLDFFDINSDGALPADGSTLVVTERNGATGVGYADLNYIYFDATSAGQILHFDIDSTTPINMVVLRRDIFTPDAEFDDLAAFSLFDEPAITTVTNEYIRFPAPGRYYFVARNPAATGPGGTYTITSTLTNMPVVPLTYGGQLNDQTLSAQGANFHSVDVTNPVWSRFTMSGTNWGDGDIRIELYDLAGGGHFGTSYPRITAANRSAAGDNFSRIFHGDSRDFLVRITSTSPVGPNAAYSLAVGDEVFTNLGMLTPGSVNIAVTALETRGTARYFARSAVGNLLRVSAAPSETVDISISQRTRDGGAIVTANEAGEGEGETLNATFLAAPNDFIAFTVTNHSPEVATDISGTAIVSAPRPYTISGGNIAMADACMGAGAQTLGTNLDDQAIGRALPAKWNFQLFGETVTHMSVSANGFIMFGDSSLGNACNGECYDNLGIPNSATPNGFLASYWDDIEGATVCVKEEATMVTVQWDGTEWRAGTATGARARHQIRLHMNGTVDFIWAGASEHVATAATATVGGETLGGTFGHQILFDTATALAGTSRTLTPQ